MFLGGIVVEDEVNHFADRHFGLDGVEGADEFLMAMALHIAADDGAVENVDAALSRSDIQVQSAFDRLGTSGSVQQLARERLHVRNSCGADRECLTRVASETLRLFDALGSRIGQ
jgi:ethanolamine utilization microcompartment shell protein EutL